MKCFKIKFIGGTTKTKSSKNLENHWQPTKTLFRNPQNDTFFSDNNFLFIGLHLYSNKQITKKLFFPELGYKEKKGRIFFTKARRKKLQILLDSKMSL